LGVPAALDRVFEALDRPGVAPVHRGVAHRGDRHVKIERRAQQPHQGHDQDRADFRAQPARGDRQHPASDQGNDSNDVEEDENGGVTVKPGDDMLGF
jgi:hypothetical protein